VEFRIIRWIQGWARALPSEGTVHDRLNDRAFEWSPIPVPGNDSGDQLLVD
jgi:hypothetical protein